MRVLLLLLLLACCVAAQDKKVKGCDTDYDKFKDVTHYRCNGILKTGFVSQLIARVSVSESGNAVFVFSTARTDLRFLRNREMNVLLDGNERFSVTVSDTDVKADFIGQIQQSLAFTVPRESFEKIANAKKVEIKIGSYEGKLDDGLIKKLKAVTAILR